MSTVTIAGREISVLQSELWTSAQRQAHSIHEVPYRACFKAELPRFFISAITTPGDTVYDPFMGRGTTLVEAALLDRRVLGNDANPLSEILVRPRLEPPSEADLAARMEAIPQKADGHSDADLSMFYSDTTMSRILALREYLRRRREDGSEDSVDRWIRMVATSRLTGHSSGFFSTYTMPPNQAVSREAQCAINKRRGQTPPDRDIASIMLRKSRQLLRSISERELRSLKAASETAKFYIGDARCVSNIPSSTVSLIVTSPPFLDVVDYAADNWIRMWFNEIDQDHVAKSLTTVRGIDQWGEFIRACLVDFDRVLVTGGWIAFEVGEVRGGTVRLEERVVEEAMRCGLHCVGIMVNKQAFTKTSNCWGVSNNTKGTNSNRIVVLRKSVAP